MVYSGRKSDDFSIELEKEKKSQEDIGRYLKSLRQKNNLSLRDVEAKLGKSNSYISLIERARKPLTIQVAVKLADIYNVPLEEMLKKIRYIDYKIYDLFREIPEAFGIIYDISHNDEWSLEEKEEMFDEFKKILVKKKEPKT